MKLSVIIPHYDSTGELSKTMKNGLLQTLENQTLSKNDFEVLIVDDLSPFSVEGLDNTALDLKYLKLEKNVGVALARQIGIEHAKGDYVLFIDNDDNLFSKDSLKTMVDALDPDTLILSSGFLEETNTKGASGKTIYLPHTKDKTWMHGKVYNRKFLMDKEISFKPHLRYCEDAYFNNIAFALSWDKTKFINDMTYIWKWNDNSITRKNDKEFNTKYFCDYIKACKTSLNNLKARNDDRLYFVVISLAMQSIGYSYYFLQQREFKKEAIKKAPSYKETIEQFKAFYKQYEGLYDVVNEQSFYEAMNSARQLQCSKALIVERQTFKQFIKGLGLKSHKVFD